MGSFVLAISIFIVEYSPVIVRFIESDSQVQVGVTAKTVSGYTVALLEQLSDLPHAQDAVVALMWAVGAGVLYLAFMGLQNVVVNIRNEIIIDTSSRNKGSIPGLLAKRFGAKILIVAALFVFFGITIFILLPYWISMLSIFVYSELAIENIGYLALGLFGLAINIYIVWAGAYFTWIYEESL